MTAVLDAAALLVTAAGVLVAVGVAATSGLRASVPVLLDFLLAVGLLRLAADSGWERIATTAAIVTVRHLISVGLAAGAAQERASHTAIPGPGGPPSTGAGRSADR